MTDGPPVQKARALKAYLVERREILKKAIAPHLDPDRMIQLVLNEIPRQPKLVDCAHESIFTSLCQSGQMGLEPDGSRGIGYITTKWNGRANRLEASFQPGYQGLMELVWRSERIARFDARPVHEGDYFRVEYGLNEQLVHRPSSEPGAQLTHVYSIAWLSGAPPQFKVMTREECEEHRDKYAPRNKEGNVVGPWVTNFIAMCLKSSIILNCKTLPRSRELAAAIAHEERFDIPIAPPVPGDNGAGDGPPPLDVNGSDTPIATDAEPYTDTGVNESGAGGDPVLKGVKKDFPHPVCPGCERAYELINGSSDVPGIGHAPDCPEA